MFTPKLSIKQRAKSYRARVQRGASGSTLAETAASMVLWIPLIVLFLFIAVEVGQVYMIQNVLAQSAREAARDLAVQYGVNPSVATSRAVAQGYTYDYIRYNNIINSSAQFADPVWKIQNNPPTVTVNVSYPVGQYGLPVILDPLHLLECCKFTPWASATYRLEYGVIAGGHNGGGCGGGHDDDGGCGGGGGDDGGCGR